MEPVRAVVAAAPGPAAFAELAPDALPAGAVTLAVEWSSLNYKDGMALTGRGKVVRSYPMTLGIDLAGTVLDSEHEAWRPGDAVLVTGCGLGETHPGGYTTRQRVSPDWLVRIPNGLDARRAMALGTAGFTAMLAAMAIESRGPASPGPGDEILVTGAAGGVGSVAVAVLSRLGYAVTASTGRPALGDYLTGLGAAAVLDRAELAAPSDRPLQSERWAGVVDTVGGTTLANALAQTRRDGVVAACGLSGGHDLPATVYPFILRGVCLAGIDSDWRPSLQRREAWARLATTLAPEVIDGFSVVRPLSQVFELAEQVLAGEVRGRIALDTSS